MLNKVYFEFFFLLKHNLTAASNTVDGHYINITQREATLGKWALIIINAKLLPTPARVNSEIMRNEVCLKIKHRNCNIFPPRIFTAAFLKCQAIELLFLTC